MILTGMIIAAVIALYVVAAFVQVHRLGISFQQAVLYLPLKAAFRVSDGGMRIARRADAPVIYAMIVPFVILDITITIYQWICFPVYGIEKVKRGDYFIFDRYHLAYLNILEAINCAYCSYGNGLMAYASEIAGRTEQYWCPIKHARKAISAHQLYIGFADFGDAETFRKKYGHPDPAVKDQKTV